MGHSRNIVIILGFVQTLSLLLPELVEACPSCFGNPNDAAVQGMNMAIISLLGITGTVLLGFAIFFLHLRRRARSLQERFTSMMN